MELTYFLPFNRLVSKRFYRIQTRLIATNDVVFLNAGYEEEPPMALPLAESDEPNRFHIQLYHRTATQVDLSGKRVLEVGCGHGGGASYLMRTVGPASYTGLDLNPGPSLSAERGTSCRAWTSSTATRKSCPFQTGPSTP